MAAAIVMSGAYGKPRGIAGFGLPCADLPRAKVEGGPLSGHAGFPKATETINETKTSPAIRSGIARRSGALVNRGRGGCPSGPSRDMLWP
jgi:hypothetical protein